MIFLHISFLVSYLHNIFKAGAYNPRTSQLGAQICLGTPYIFYEYNNWMKILSGGISDCGGQETLTPALGMNSNICKGLFVNVVSFVRQSHIARISGQSSCAAFVKIYFIYRWMNKADIHIDRNMFPFSIQFKYHCFD